jgi:hypothetical protein
MSKYIFKNLSKFWIFACLKKHSEISRYLLSFGLVRIVFLDKSIVFVRLKLLKKHDVRIFLGFRFEVVWDVTFKFTMVT